MHTLDSRSLSVGNCFGQKFPKAGEVRYFVSAGALIPSAAKQTDGGYVIEVLPAAKGVQAQQYNVAVSMKDGALTVSPEKLKIHAGEGVLWHTVDPAVAGFQVSGAGKGFRFDSASIEDDAVFTHAFGVPGKYEWTDPNGSGVGGTIEVEPVNLKRAEDRDRWFETVQKAGAVKIKGKSSSPASVKIVVGQTVFWSITESPGVAITDGRLVRRGDHDHDNDHDHGRSKHKKGNRDRD
jgi:plastocyanin